MRTRDFPGSPVFYPWNFLQRSVANTCRKLPIAKENLNNFSLLVDKCSIGDSFHHARLYRIKKGQKTVYAVMRVYTTDLSRARNEDLFAYELNENSMIMRKAESKLRAAFRDGTAEYVTWLVVGDELKFDTKKVAKGQVATFLEEFGEINRWRIRRFYSEARLRLKPSQFSSEGISEETSLDSKKVIDSPGWLPAINIVFSQDVVVIRRDAHGRPRVTEAFSSLPKSLKVG